MSAPVPGPDTATVGVAACAAMVALWAWCGPMADGTHRRLMVWSNVGSAAPALTMGLGAQALWPVYLVAALMGAAVSLYGPARAGIDPEMLPGQDFLAVNALGATVSGGALLPWSARRTPGWRRSTTCTRPRDPTGRGPGRVTRA